MGSPYYVPMYAMHVKKPNLDLSPMAEGFEALRQRRLQDEVGQMMSGNDLKGASRAAYRGGDVRTGNELRRMQHTEEDRAISASNRQAASADREAKAKADSDAKARSYVSNMMTTLDPSSSTFADDWKHHLGRLRAAGYEIGPEYDDPRTGYQAALSEVSSFKDRSAAANQRRDDDMRQQEIDIRRQEIDSRSLSRNRKDALSAIKLMRDSTTPEQWQQNSGVINAVFGRPVPFNERNVVLAQAESATAGGDEFEPSERDRTLGVTRDDKIRDAQNAEFKKTYGEPKRGFVWQRGQDGQVTQVPVARTMKAVDPQMEKAVGAMVSRLDDAEKVLLNSSYLGAAAGTRGYGDAGRAYEDFEMAALGAVYAMSGKQTTNREMERFLSINKPQWDDRSETIQIRTGRIKNLLNAIYGAMQQGMDYDDAERAALTQAASAKPKTASPGNSLEGMSDDDLLRALEGP